MLSHYHQDLNASIDVPEMVGRTKRDYLVAALCAKVGALHMASAGCVRIKYFVVVVVLVPFHMGSELLDKILLSCQAVPSRYFSQKEQTFLGTFFPLCLLAFLDCQILQHPAPSLRHMKENKQTTKKEYHILFLKDSTLRFS